MPPRPRVDGGSRSGECLGTPPGVGGAGVGGQGSVRVVGAWQLRCCCSGHASPFRPGSAVGVLSGVLSVGVGWRWEAARLGGLAMCFASGGVADSEAL